MEFLALFIRGIALVLDTVLYLCMILIIARAVLSWVSPDPNNPIVRFLYTTTEPVLYRVRKAIPMPGLGLDLSPIIVLLAIIFLQAFLVQSLFLLAQKMG